MATTSDIFEGICSGEIVPFIGPDALNGVTNIEDNSPIPANSDSLILAMNNGQPMAPRLMYEFPRAAMHLENKKGRKFIENFLVKTYSTTQWTRSAFHQWLADQNLPYIIDCNRDTQIQECYQGRPHTLIVGVARIAAHPYRFDIYENSGTEYKPISLEDVNKKLPVIFKPLGTPLPKPSFVASDADFVDYITELMGGFAIPNWIKDYRKNKQYLFLGMRFTRDTERMIMSDLIFNANCETGWALIKEPTDKEKKYLSKKNIRIIEKDFMDFFEESKNLETAVA